MKNAFKRVGNRLEHLHALGSLFLVVIGGRCE